jgi:hypothetical protein
MPERSLEPEWATAREIRELFGLTKGMLLKLANDGRITSTIIKSHPDARKGARRFSVASVRQLFSETLSGKEKNRAK